MSFFNADGQRETERERAVRRENSVVRNGKRVIFCIRRYDAEKPQAEDTRYDGTRRYDERGGGCVCSDDRSARREVPSHTDGGAAVRKKV